MLQESVFNGVWGLSYTNAVTEVTDGLGRVAAAAQTAQGGHAGVIPAGNVTVLNQRSELTLTEHGVVDTQSCKLNLTRGMGHRGVLHNPVVQRSVVFKLQAAQGVGDTLQCVLDRMSKVVHGVDAPLVALAMVMHVTDSVNNRITHIEVAGSQVDLGTQGHCVVRELTGTHPGKQVQTFLDGTVTIGGSRGGIQIAAELLCLLRGQLADICQALLDQLNGILVVLLEVVGAVEETITPVKAQPVNVFLDRVNELHILLGGVGIVHTQVTHTAELLGSAEVDDQCLAVADVQIAIGLGGKTGMHSSAFIAAAFCNILFNKRVDEILAFGDFSHKSHPLYHRKFQIIITDCRKICNTNPIITAIIPKKEKGAKENL